MTGTPRPRPLAVLFRDVTRLESLRTAKDVQRAYAHFIQAGRWAEAAALFATDATVHWGAQEIHGRARIGAWLQDRLKGAAAQGWLNTEIIDEPVAHISPHSSVVYARWAGMAFRGDGAGQALIEGGVYENEYVLRDGRWLIASLRYFPQFDGPYATGWTNAGGRELAIVPTHFGAFDAGIPLMAPVGDHIEGAQPADADDIAARIDRLNAEDDVRNLAHAYGYYVDRRMWDDVVDLFDTVATVTLEGVEFHGVEGVRHAHERLGPPGLRYGEVNERPQFDLMVEIAPDGREATARGIQLGILGDVTAGEAHWEFGVISMRLRKSDDGRWRIGHLEVALLLRASYAEGWGSGGIAASIGTLARGRPLPPGVDPHWRQTAAQTGGHPAHGFDDPGTDLADLERRFRRSAAYDGIENVSGAYGYFLDDFRWADMAALFAHGGHKQSAFAGYAVGREAILGTAIACYGPTRPFRTAVSFHWRTQPVIHVSPDARSANLRTRLFQPRTAITPDATPHDFYMGGLHSGMYPNDQAVLEEGAWRLWSLAVDEHYFASHSWKGGWSGVAPRPPGEAPRRSIVLDRYPPHILLRDIVPREVGFRGGPGRLVEWPEILPMWFHYRNPVSGRIPEHFWPDCVPSVVAPETRMTAHGYQHPPNGPQPADPRTKSLRYVDTEIKM